MAKKTATEYEAMVGGLMHRIETLSDELGCAKHNWEQWQARAEKAEAELKRRGAHEECLVAQHRRNLERD